MKKIAFLSLFSALIIFISHISAVCAAPSDKNPLPETKGYQNQGGEIWANPATVRQVSNNQGYGSGVALPTDVGLPQGTIAGIISNLTMWLLGIFGFIAIISFVISGIMYLTAAGDKDQQEKAKNQMKWSILGVIVGLSGLIIIKTVDAWLKGTLNL